MESGSELERPGVGVVVVAGGEGLVVVGAVSEF